MIWNPNKECMSRDERSALQGKRLHKIVEYVYHNVPFYRNKLQEMDIRPDDIQTIEDIKKLPFTTKKDLRDNYPFGLQAAPQSEIIRIHASSGTTGKPTIVGYTRKDIGVWSECMARCLTAFGVTRNDIFSVAYGYGLFTGGLGAHYGVEHLGASVIPASTGNTEKHLKLIRDLGITGLACTPSYALYLAETMEKLGITKEQIKLRVGAFGAEPWTEQMRHEIEEKLGLKGYNIYGLSEVMGPSVSYECQMQHGSHINEDHFYPEIINPTTLESLPDGQTGELVFTTLTKEGMPVIRYRTRDLCSLIPGTCDCGRTNIRMGRIEGRSDDRSRASYSVCRSSHRAICSSSIAKRTSTRCWFRWKSARSTSPARSTHPLPSMRSKRNWPRSSRAYSASLPRYSSRLRAPSSAHRARVLTS